MATRDRTTLFTQYRNSYSSPLKQSGRSRGAGGGAGGMQQSSINNGLMDEDSRGLLHGGSGQGDAYTMIEMSQLPPRWMDIVGDVNEEMVKIKDKINLVESMQKKHILPGFQDTSRDQETIESISHEITMSKIKKIGADGGSSDTSGPDRVIAKNVQISLAGKLQELSTRFRKSQAVYLQKIRGRDMGSGGGGGGASLGNSAVGKDLFSQFSSTGGGGGGDTSFDLGFTQQQMETIFRNESSIDTRTAEINEVAKSINELAEIFRDLQTMVIDQGTILDRIDYNIEQVHVSVKQAHEELVIGEKYQKKSKSKYCIIMLVLLITILFIILFLKQAARGGGKK